MKRCLLIRFSLIIIFVALTYPGLFHSIGLQPRGCADSYLALAKEVQGINRQAGTFENPKLSLLELTVDNYRLDVTIICIVIFCEDDAPA